MENFSEKEYYNLVAYAKALINGKGIVLVTGYDLVHEVYARDGACTKEKIKQLWYKERDYYRENYRPAGNSQPANELKACKSCKDVFPIGAYRLLKHKNCPKGYRDWLCQTCRRKQNVIDTTRRRKKNKIDPNFIESNRQKAKEKEREKNKERCKNRYQNKKKSDPNFLKTMRENTQAYRQKKQHDEKQKKDKQANNAGDGYAGERDISAAPM